ncbi:MAG: galactokinase [Anaerolineales bacterium]|jgi:galactokinase
MDLRQKILVAFQQRFGADPEFWARAPGRVNLLGEHVDYNEGFVLPAAIDRDTLVAFRRSGSPRSTLVALDLGEEISLDSQSVLDKQDSDGVPLSGWALYPGGVSWALIAARLGTPGMDAVFASQVPRGAGLSSSASVEMAFGVAWKKLGGWSIPPIQMAQICLKAETQYVGVNCGIMDQFTTACGIKDRLLYLDCRSLEWRPLRLPDKTVIVIADTTVRRSLTDTSYNDRHSSCEEAVRIFQEALPGIYALRDVSQEQFQRYSDQLPPVVAKRARHVVEEIARTERAVGLLEKNDAAGFGELMNLCHASLRDLYEVSCPELDTMAALARSLPGCYGARLTGGGFGGCTVNLVAAPLAGNFAAQLSADYEKATGLHPEVFICRAVDGAGVETI